MSGDGENDLLLSGSKSKSINTTDDHDGVASQKKNSGAWMEQWRKISFFIFPIEIVVFLFMFGVYFQMQVFQQFYFQRIFREMIIDWTNDSQLNHSCLYQDLIVNLTSAESFVEGQKKVNLFSMLTTVIYLVPSILVSPLIGSLSDQLGRKLSIQFIFVGQIISAVVGTVVVYLDLNMLFLLIGSFATGICGGFGIMLGSSFSYITDITSKKWLTIRMGLLEASIFVATAVSSASSDSWIQKTDCIFKPQVWVVLATVTTGFLYALVLPESLGKDLQIKSIFEFKCGLGRLTRGFKLFFWPSYIGSNLWKLWIAVVVMDLAMINETGITEISSYFLHNKPLQWTYDQIGGYLALTSVSHLLALVIILPIFVLLKFPDSLISLIGVIVSCCMSVYTALLVKTWEMYTGQLMALQPPQLCVHVFYP